MSSEGEVVTSDANTKAREVKTYTLSQIAALLFGVGILCVVLGSVFGVMLSSFYFSPPNRGSSIRTTQQVMMEEVRATLIASTEQALLSNGVTDPDSPLQMARIHEFHDLLRNGLYDQAWCIAGRGDTPWPSSLAEFAEFWDTNPAYLSAPVIPVQDSSDWFLVRIRWEDPGTEEQLRYRMTYGFQFECEGWIIAEVVPTP